MTPEAAVWIEGDGVRVEGRLREGAGSLAAVILHPHPQHGGDMNNHVVRAVADALAAAGATTLRFNFRGVGGSAGTYSGGSGEAADAAGAVQFLRERRPSARLLVAGYSFGAMIAAAIAESVRPDAMLLISPPLAYSALATMPEGLRVLAIAGDRDRVAPVDAVRALEVDKVKVIIVPGADHGWWPGAELLAVEVQKFAEQRGRAGSDP